MAGSLNIYDCQPLGGTFLAACPYGIEDGFFSLEWMTNDYLFDTDYAPLFWLLFMGEKLWLA